MPDPLATIQQIKTRTPDSDVLLLLPTEYDFKLVSAVMRCGVSDCLVKPFDQPSLTKIVAKIKNIPDPLAEEEETQSSDADKGIDDISSFPSRPNQSSTDASNRDAGLCGSVETWTSMQTN